MMGCHSWVWEIVLLDNIASRAYIELVSLSCDALMLCDMVFQGQLYSCICNHLMQDNLFLYDIVCFLFFFVFTQWGHHLQQPGRNIWLDQVWCYIYFFFLFVCLFLSVKMAFLQDLIAILLLSQFQSLIFYLDDTSAECFSCPLNISIQWTCQVSHCHVSLHT